MRNEKRILLSYPHLSGKEEAQVAQAFASNWIAPLGPKVEEFEGLLAQKSGVGQVLALNSGTAALHLALKLAGVTQGDLVLASSFTFIATLSPALYQGADLWFVDSDEETWNMSPAALEKAFAEARRQGRPVKAVIVAELYGLCPHMDELKALCQQNGALLIEDAAEALGSVYKGRPCGSLGDLGAYSFNGNKIITTSGGGALLCKTKEQRDKAFFWATQARENEPWYQHKEVGYNYRLSNLCAAVGVGQMAVLDDRVNRRRAIYDRYKAELADLPLDMMPQTEETYSNCWLSAMTLRPGAKLDFMGLLKALDAANIETRPLWKPMHLQPLFAGAPYFTHGDVSICDDLFSRGLCLPSCSAMTDDEQSFVIDALHRALA